MSPMLVALFIETGADDLLTGQQDKRRRVIRGQARQKWPRVIRVAA